MPAAWEAAPLLDQPAQQPATAVPAWADAPLAEAPQQVTTGDPANASFVQGEAPGILRQIRESDLVRNIIGPSENQRMEDQRRYGTGVTDSLGRPGLRGSRIDRQGLLPAMFEPGNNPPPWTMAPLDTEQKASVATTIAPFLGGSLAGDASKKQSEVLAGLVNIPIGFWNSATGSLGGLATGGLGSTVAKVPQLAGAVEAGFAAQTGAQAAVEVPHVTKVLFDPNVSLIDKAEAAAGILAGLAFSGLSGYTAYRTLNPAKYAGLSNVEQLARISADTGKTVEQIAADVEQAKMEAQNKAVTERIDAAAAEARAKTEAAAGAVAEATKGADTVRVAETAPIDEALASVDSRETTLDNVAEQQRKLAEASREAQPARQAAEQQIVAAQGELTAAASTEAQLGAAQSELKASQPTRVSLDDEAAIEQQAQLQAAAPSQEGLSPETTTAFIERMLATYPAASAPVDLATKYPEPAAAIATDPRLKGQRLVEIRTASGEIVPAIMGGYQEGLPVEMRDSLISRYESMGMSPDEAIAKADSMVGQSISGGKWLPASGGTPAGFTHGKLLGPSEKLLTPVPTFEEMQAVKQLSTATTTPTTGSANAAQTQGLEMKEPALTAQPAVGAGSLEAVPRETVAQVEPTASARQVEPIAAQQLELAVPRRTEAITEVVREPPKPPEEPPITTTSPTGGLPPETALNKAGIGEMREMLNLEALPEPVRKTTADALERVKANNGQANAETIAADITASPRFITADEHVAMTLRYAELQNSLEAIGDDIARAFESGDEAKGKALRKISDGIVDQIDRLETASDLGGTEVGRALSIRRMRLQRENYRLATVTNQLKVAKKGALTEQEHAAIKSMTERHATNEKKIAELEQALAAKVAEIDKVKAQTFVSEGRARRRSVKVGEARTRREGYKKELAALGYRMNDVTNTVGIGAEAANIIAKIADTYIEEGVANLTELVGKLKTDIPDISEQDIYASVGRQVKAEKAKIVGEAQARISELRKQSALWSKIHAALDGKTEAGKKLTPTDQVKHLRDILAELRRQANRTTFDDATLKAINEKINAVQDQLAGGFRNIVEPKPATKPPTPDIQAARKELAELERTMRTEDSVAELERQIREDDLKVSAPEQRIIQNARLEEALIRKKQLEREIKNYIEAKRKKTLREKAIEGALLPRTLITIADLSSTLRQNALLGVRRPITWAKSTVEGLKSLLSQHSADEIELAIERRPDAIEGTKAGLFLSKLDVALHEREQYAMSSMAEKIPGWGRLVRASNRAMTSSINLMRVAAFDGFIKDNPTSTPAQRKAYAEYVNAATGRGNLGSFSQAARNLSTVFFAPRYAVSRFQTLYSPLKNIRDPIVRNSILKDMGAFAGTGLAVLALAAAAGAEVGDDTTKSDFGRIKIGNTYIDIWAGLQQPVRLILLAFVAALRRTGISEITRDVNLYDAGSRFMTYKLSPGITVPVTLVTGKNVVNQPQDVPETLVRAITPLLLQDVYDTYEGSGDPAKAALVGLGSFFGLTVSEHAPKEKKVRARPIRSTELMESDRGQLVPAGSP